MKARARLPWRHDCLVVPHGRAACGHHRVIVPDGAADTIERSGCGNSRINGVSDHEFWRFPASPRVQGVRDRSRGRAFLARRTGRHQKRTRGTRSRAKTRGSRATRDKGQARQPRNLDSLALSASAIRPIPKRSRARVARSHGSRRLTGARACLTWSPSSRSAGWCLRRIARTDSGCSGCQLRSRPDLLEGLVADRIQAPVLVVEVPPLRVINAEALRFHGPAE